MSHLIQLRFARESEIQDLGLVSEIYKKLYCCAFSPGEEKIFLVPGKGFLSLAELFEIEESKITLAVSENNGHFGMVWNLGMFREFLGQRLDVLCIKCDRLYRPVVTIRLRVQIGVRLETLSLRTARASVFVRWLIEIASGLRLRRCCQLEVLQDHYNRFGADVRSSFTVALLGCSWYLYRMQMDAE